MTSLDRPLLIASRRSQRIAAVIFVLALLGTGCRVEIDQSIGQAAQSTAAVSDDASSSASGADGDNERNDTAANAASTPATGIDGLPSLGPVPERSHWHAAYVVRVCDQVLDPFESENDPIGIHSHNDGLIHIHPFVAAAGFENATLGVFAEAMGFSISEGELVLPSGVTWRDGDNCNSSRGRVFVDRWSGPGLTGERERIFENLESIRFRADREVFQIGFAAEDSAPVVPPSVAALENVSAAIVVDEVWVDLAPAPDLASVKLWVVDSVTEPPCADDMIIERTKTGSPGCFTSIDEQFDRSRAVFGARAVSFNRRAAVELTITDEFRQYLVAQLRSAESAVMAIEVGGEVVYAISYDSNTLSDNLLIVRGGLDADAARAMALLFAI